MNTKRRKFVINSAASSLGVIAGLISPQLLAKTWPKDAFQAKSLDEALTRLGAKDAYSDAVNIMAPKVAEDGTVVPISITTSLENVNSISILVEGNDTPLVAKFDLTSRVKPALVTRIKMAKSSKVIAVVETDSQLCKASQHIRVIKGGCGK